jgi:recombination protein RecA
MSNSKIDLVIAQINKTYGKNIIGPINTLKDIAVERIPTGIKKLDKILGGGFLQGRMVELFGLPAAGKSVISLITIKQFQDKGLSCILIDAEKSFDAEFAKKFGVDTDKLIIVNLSVGEEIVDTIAKLLSSKPGIIVIDSVAAMVPKEEMAKSAEENTMALKARIMSKGLAKLNALNKKSLIVWINQMRSTLSLFGAKSTTTGGRALGHFASIRLKVWQGEKLTVDNKKTGDVIGQIIQINCEKNKTAQPYGKCSFKFYYNPVKIEE